jgi:hypothetical protein
MSETTVKATREESIAQFLADYLDGHVCVYISQKAFVRNPDEEDGFPTCLSISGTLEQHPSGQYRVLNDDDNYVYFSLDDVFAVVHNEGRPRPNICIMFPWDMDSVRHAVDTFRGNRRTKTSSRYELGPVMDFFGSMIDNEEGES